MSSPPPAGAREVFPTGGVIPAGAVGQQHQQLAISNGVLLAAVIFLFMVVVFVFLLYLYAKRYLGANPLLLPPGPGTPSSSRFVFVDASPLASRGLPAAALRMLPVTVYAKPSGTGKEENEEALLECAVCLSEVADGEKVRALPKCGHGFHVDCIDMWFHSHDTCPLCRAPVAVAAEGLPRVPREEPAAAAALEFPMFPTNVLFWGTHDDVTVNTLTPHPPPPPPAPVAAASSSSSGRRKENLVIDIPARPVAVANSPLTSPLPTSSPVSARLRSLRRLLSRGKQAVVGGATSSSYSYSPRGDIEQGGGGFAGPETPRPPKTPKAPPPPPSTS